jgi:hypothetical protein
LSGETVWTKGPPLLVESSPLPSQNLLSSQLAVLDPVPIQWFENLQKSRMRRWATWATIILVVGLTGETLAQLFVVPALIPAERAWVFSAGFTAAMVGAILLITSVSTLRSEGTRVGVSALGVHQDRPRPTPTSPNFLPWNAMASVGSVGDPTPTAVLIKTVENRTIGLLVAPEAITVILRGFESARSGPESGGSAATSGLVPEAAASEPPIPSPADMAGVPWKPNRLHRYWRDLGLVMLAVGVVLVVVLAPYALNPKTSEVVIYIGLPFFIGIVCVSGARGFASDIAVGPSGFLLKRKGVATGLRFQDITAVSTAGASLECTLTSGRTVNFGDLGPGEKQSIQEAYVAFRRRGQTPLPNPSPATTAVTWLPNPPAFRALAGFYLPLSIFIGAVVILVPLAFWNPTVYRSDLAFIALAAIPATLTLFTIGPYRRAPKAVGFSSEGVIARYPHQMAPASALHSVAWSDIERASGRYGQVITGSADHADLLLSSVRYLTLHTCNGVSYTLGPVTPDIVLRILRNIPKTAVVTP